MNSGSNLVKMDELPESARVWIYASDRDLNELEENRVVEMLSEFCAGWTSHSRPVRSAVDVIDGRFAVIAGLVQEGDISGCGIDKSTVALKTAAAELALEWLPGLYVHYRDRRGVVHSVPRRIFRELVERGDVSAESPVFDMTIETLGQLRSGGFERPAGETWHARVFGLRPQAA